MHPKEARDLGPLPGEAVRAWQRGELLNKGHPLWSYWLLARERGLVKRDSQGEIIITERATEYFSLRSTS